MNTPVIALGLDGTDPQTLETWMERGYLENLRRLRDRGVYARLKTVESYVSESAAISLLAGRSPQSTGYWTAIEFQPQTYEVKKLHGDEFAEALSDARPFYALGERCRTAVFDMPQGRVCDRVNGIQILAWGERSPRAESQSQPPHLLQELIDKYGTNPIRHLDPNIRNLKTLQGFVKRLKTSTSRRAAICRDLLQRERWDLFLTLFGEPHHAGHALWHLSQPSHPLYSTFASRVEGDPLLEVFQALDKAIGEILAIAPEEAYIVIFSDSGMCDNATDLPSMVFIPELLYRYNFPGQYGLAASKTSAPPPPPYADRSEWDWLQALWRLKHEPNPLMGWLRRRAPIEWGDRIAQFFRKPNKPDFLSPFELQKQSHPYFYQPAMWYKRFWPQMKAFALPSFSDGHIRINLQGREAGGIVAPADYEALCQELTQKLYDLVDARTGAPVVKEVLRTRASATEESSKLPDADLIVLWHKDRAIDVIDSPEFGRIGPAPSPRSGGHRSDIFFMATGPGIEPGSSLPLGHALDIAPTILHLMGMPIPDSYEGKSLLKIGVTAH
ncbi:alkaline phosphatase family protein [Oscillatoria sp. FACHB-1406]|uniref:alkaline phosphatase family protein n=1 Tax=Oscillatoria sp. FACHB-1406 TaxID=2692846 RepID=UPI001685C49C|nr:alkaline phosphatase family protein [Oscillatoria sp. FACHB-1406]MBD2577591.1 alkaline phosphatase family protein [Oscillatoria sp. FACHB-1406]